MKLVIYNKFNSFLYVRNVSRPMRPSARRLADKRSFKKFIKRERYGNNNYYDIYIKQHICRCNIILEKVKRKYEDF